MRIYNNVIYGHTSGFTTYRGIQVYADGSSGTWNFDDWIISNNIFVDIPIWALYFKVRTGAVSYLSNSKINNNIFYNTHTQAFGTAVIIGMIYDPLSDGVEFKNNMIHPGNNGQSTVSWDGISYSDEVSLNNAPGASGNRYALPSFAGYLEYASTDLHLNAGSNGIDDGIDMSPYFTTDFDGISRPQGSAWDIGAYEYIP